MANFLLLMPKYPLAPSSDAVADASKRLGRR